MLDKKYGDILWFVRDQVAEVAGLLLDFSEWYSSKEVQQTFSLTLNSELTQRWGNSWVSSSRTTDLSWFNQLWVSSPWIRSVHSFNKKAIINGAVIPQLPMLTGEKIEWLYPNWKPSCMPMVNISIGAWRTHELWLRLSWVSF